MEYNSFNEKSVSTYHHIKIYDKNVVIIEYKDDYNKSGKLSSLIRLHINNDKFNDTVDNLPDSLIKLRITSKKFNKNIDNLPEIKLFIKSFIFALLML